MEKIYRVQMNSKGMPNFSTAKEIPSVNMPIKEKCCFCPHCENCDVNDDLTIADGSQEEVDAVEIYERAERRLERSEISLGEFESIINPLRHLYYGRPQEWVDKAISIINDMQSEGIVDYEQAREFRMRARLKGADDADG